MSCISVLSGTLLLSLFVWEPAKRLFSLGPVVRVGQLTYGLYFFHFLGLNLSLMLIGGVFKAFHSNNIMGFWVVYAVAGLLLSGGLAFLSWHLLEKRFYFLRKRFSKVHSGFG